MDAIIANRPDVASDTVNPLFAAGSGIRILSLPSRKHEEQS